MIIPDWWPNKPRVETPEEFGKRLSEEYAAEIRRIVYPYIAMLKPKNRPRIIGPKRRSP